MLSGNGRLRESVDSAWRYAVSPFENVDWVVGAGDAGADLGVFGGEGSGASGTAIVGGVFGDTAGASESTGGSGSSAARGVVTNAPWTATGEGSGEVLGVGF